MNMEGAVKVFYGEGSKIEVLCSVSGSLFTSVIVDRGTGPALSTLR